MAARFWNKQNASANWNVTAPTNWGSASGVADGASVPGVGDDVTFDGAGVGGNAACTISAPASALSFNMTSGYTGTITRTSALTVAGNFTDGANGSWAGAAGLTISAASTITSNGKTWSNTVAFTGANTKTLSGNWSITGLLTVSAATTLNTAILTLAGGLTNNSGVLSGTTAIVITGGTLQGTQAIQNSLSFAGNVTVSSFAYNTGTLTYTSGTITVSGTLTVASSTTWNTAGISWTNITFSASGTHTINSLLTVTVTMQVANGAAVTFAGTTGFFVNSFSAIHTTAQTLTFKNGVTYTIYGFFLSFLAPNSNGNLFTSDDGTARTNIVLANASTVCNTNARFTRVNASGGKPIVTFNQTITDSINVYNQTNVLFRPVESFNRSGRRMGLLNKNKSVIFQ